jgi:hypothetical protein
VAAPTGSNTITLSYGVRGGTETGRPGYGKNGDAFIYASADTNGVCIINQFDTDRENYIRFYAGKDANGTIPDIHIHGSGSNKGYVGINTANPQANLHINGTLAKSTSSGPVPTTPGVDGEIRLVNDGGDYYLCVYIGNGWRKTQLT